MRSPHGFLKDPENHPGDNDILKPYGLFGFLKHLLDDVYNTLVGTHTIKQAVDATTRSSATPDKTAEFALGPI